MKPPGDVLRRGQYIVESIPLGMGRELVDAHHYARGSSNTAVYRHGLFRPDNPMDCLGAALWMPVLRVVGESVAGDDWRAVLNLSRLVVEPGMPTNAASFLLAGSIKLIRRDARYRTLVTYADEGQGHTGAIYRATNWEYRGAPSKRPIWVDRDGRHVATRTTGSTRTVAEMEALGYQQLPATRKHKFVMQLT